MQFKAIDAFYSAERRLEEQERSGVDAEVVSPMPPLLDYALSGPEGLELSRRVNEFIASLCAADPGRLMGMGMVPMQAPELACAELARVQDAGLVAVEIASNVLGRALHGSEFAEFWAEAERLEMPIFVHAMPTDFGERLPAGPIPIAGVRGRRRRALACAGIITSGLAERHPRAPAGLQSRRRRLPDDAPARDVLLGEDLERGAAGRGGRGRLAGGADAALLLRRARVRPPGAAAS